MPTRSRKPRDKAKVETAVLIIERWILTRLRNTRFFSLAEFNIPIRTLVDELNARLMRKLGASRREFFDTLDLPALMSQPAAPHQVVVAPDVECPVALAGLYSLQNYLKIFSPTYRPRTILVGATALLQSVAYYAVAFYFPVIAASLFGDSLLQVILASLFFNMFGCGSCVGILGIDPHRSQLVGDRRFCW
jgi:hypothetical protein